MRKIKRLEERLDALEIALLALEQRVEQGQEESKQSELMQEGIDNILGYEWPPKKGGNK